MIGSAKAGEPAPIPDLAVLALGQTSLLLGNHASIMEDPSGEMTLAQVTSPALAGRFKPIGSPSLNLGLNQRVHWLRFSLALDREDVPLATGDNSERVTWVLSTGLPLPDWSTWALYERDRLVASSQSLKVGEPVSLILGRLSTRARTFYLRFETTSALLIRPEVMLQSAWSQHQAQRLLLLGIFCGIILGTIIYNLFLYLGLRDPICILFAAQTLFVGAYVAGLNGLPYRYLVEVDPLWVGHVNRFFLGMALFFTLIFTRHFLALREHVPSLNRGLKFFTGLTLVCCLMALLLSVQGQNHFFALWSVLALAALTLATVVMLRRGFLPARLFLLAWILMATGGLAFIMVVLRMLPYTWLTMYGFQVGAALGTVMLSLGLADRIRILRMEKVAAQAADQAKDDLIRFLPDATFAVDIKGRITAWNRAMEKLSGIKAQDMLGQGDHAYAEPFWGERRPVLIDMVIAPHQEIEPNYLVVEKDGNILQSESFHPNFKPGGAYIFAAAGPLYDARGRLVGAIESVRDVTEQKLAHKESLARERLQSAVETAGAACHELNQPLQAVLSQVELTLLKVPPRDPLAAELRRMLANIHKMAEITQRLSRITDYRTRPYVGQAQILDLASASDQAPDDEKTA